jgi:hypothetical protein
VRPPTAPSEPAALPRPDLEVIRAAPAEPVPFVRHVAPEPGSPAARQPVRVPLRTAPEPAPGSTAPVPAPGSNAPVDAAPLPDRRAAVDRAPDDRAPVFTAVDVLPERHGFWARLRR